MRPRGWKLNSSVCWEKPSENQLNVWKESNVSILSQCTARLEPSQMLDEHAAFNLMSSYRSGTLLNMSHFKSMWAEPNI